MNRLHKRVDMMKPIAKVFYSCKKWFWAVLFAGSVAVGILIAR